jgi:hypothetical protein
VIVLCRSREEDTGLDGAASKRLDPRQEVWVGCKQVRSGCKQSQVILIIVLIFLFFQICKLGEDLLTTAATHVIRDSSKLHNK